MDIWIKEFSNQDSSFEKGGELESTQCLLPMTVFMTLEVPNLIFKETIQSKVVYLDVTYFNDENFHHNTAS